MPFVLSVIMLNAVMVSVVMLNAIYTECHIHALNVQCHIHALYAECHYAECRVALLLCLCIKTVTSL